jgi:hypothetical protein
MVQGMTCLTRRPLNSRDNDATKDANHEHGLNDEAMRNIRNKAAHDKVLGRDEAQEARSWAMQILRQV